MLPERMNERILKFKIFMSRFVTAVHIDQNWNHTDELTSKDSDKSA